MILNVSTGDNTIFQEQKIQDFSHNSYDDVGVLFLTIPYSPKLSYS
jgi:hypothetical protein